MLREGENGNSSTQNPPQTNETKADSLHYSSTNAEPEIFKVKYPISFPLDNPGSKSTFSIKNGLKNHEIRERASDPGLRAGGADF